MRQFATGITLTVLAALLTAGAVSAQSQRTIEKVLFEDGHIRFVEVTNWPGENHADAILYSSIVMADAAWPAVREAPAEATASRPESHSDNVLPRDNRPYPWCRAQSPVAARTVTVKGDFPQHYYRIDYKRIDGKEFGAHWKTWYGDVFGPPAKVVADPGKTLQSATPFSKDWPYNIGYSATVSAPANHTLRYEDDHIQLLEVAIREGEKENMHGHPYPSVYADDGGFAPEGAVYKNATLEPSDGPPWGKMTTAPQGANFPICFSAVPEAPHEVSVEKGPPQHFYRIHFKRVDGAAIKENWRAWYP